MTNCLQKRLPESSVTGGARREMKKQVSCPKAGKGDTGGPAATAAPDLPRPLSYLSETLTIMQRDVETFLS